MSEVEVIIPAHNEERTIAAVVEAARSCPLVRRVHVVDDGSRDATATRAQAAGADVHRLRPNRGKTGALIEGAAACRAEIVVLLDGDLIGLTPGHVRDLIAPVLEGRAGMSIGIFRDGRWITDLSQRLTPFLNGQRALRREILSALDRAGKLRYAADTLLSRYARRMGIEVCPVVLPNLTHVMKEEKIGWARGVLARLVMYCQVARAFLVRLPRPPCEEAERRS